MRRIGAAQCGELERGMADTRGIWLRIAGRRAEPARLHLRGIPVVVVERPVLLARDHNVPERRLCFSVAARTRRSRGGRPEGAARDGDTCGAGPPQEVPRVKASSPVICPPSLSLAEGEGAARPLPPSTLLPARSQSQRNQASHPALWQLQGHGKDDPPRG